MGHLMSITYLSRATAPQSTDQLAELLDVSRSRNSNTGITGLLLYAQEKFIQTLEGERADVEATMSRILADPRHRDVDVTLIEDLSERNFVDWAMGFRVVSTQDLSALSGYSDFLVPGSQMYRYAQHLGRAGVFHRIFRDLHPDETDYR